MTNDNPYSHLTAKERESLSFPARMLLQQGKLQGRILDFGCGFGKDVEELKAQGYDITGYDPHYQPHYPTGTFDTILCLYVLNVLRQPKQSEIIMQISRLLKPTGTAYFAVRRDIAQPGFRLHKVHRQPTYQCNVLLPFTSLYRNDSCELYSYRHYNQLPHSIDTTCPFCNVEAERELVLESATTFAIYDKYPVSPGHTLIIPKRHVANYFDLNFKEQAACLMLLNKVKEVLDKTYHPDGYNIGVNAGEGAGQTVGHVHLHLIPRYKGDVENPAGGVRGVIPGKQRY